MTRPTISDDTLVLYYYDDGLDDGERRAIAEALRSQAEVRLRYRRLCDGLEALPAPAPALVDDRRARLHAALDRAADADRGAAPHAARGLHPPSMLAGIAVAAALIFGIAIGVRLDGVTSGSTDPTTAAAARDPAAFTRGVALYFRDSGERLATVGTMPDADRVLLVADIIRRNRLYERTADSQGAGAVARVLRAFEPVLAQLAVEELSPGEAAELGDQLAFEMQVMLTKLDRQPSDIAATQTERT